MDCGEKLLEALQECGEAAILYRGKKIQKANENFAALLERTVEECEGLSILEICHNESIEMIQDYIRRRALGDRTLPSSYEAAFRIPSDPKVMMNVTVLKVKSVEGAFVIFRSV